METPTAATVPHTSVLLAYVCPANLLYRKDFYHLCYQYMYLHAMKILEQIWSTLVLFNLFVIVEALIYFGVCHGNMLVKKQNTSKFLLQKN